MDITPPDENGGFQNFEPVQEVVILELEDPPEDEELEYDDEALSDGEMMDEGEPGQRQKVNRLAKLVPYRRQLEESRLSLWANLKKNLCIAIVAQGQPLQEWIYACEQYLNAFGLAITKAEHILLIEICWEALYKMEHDYATMRKLARFVTRLLRKPKYISRDNLKLDWRQFYDLLERTMYSSHVQKHTVLYEPEFTGELKELVVHARVYFSREATGEMMQEWYQNMCIYSNNYRKYLGLFKTFLPTVLPPYLHRMGHNLWFEQFMDLWLQLPNQDLDYYQCYAQLFANLAKGALGYVNWEPYMPQLFARFKKAMSGFIVISPEVDIIAQWIVYMIYEGSSCLANLKQVFEFKLAESKTMLSAIMDVFLKRLRYERYLVPRPSYDFTTESHWLSDEIAEEFGRFVFKQFKKQSFSSFDVEFIYKMSLFCSELLPKEVTTKLKLAQERYFEPNRLQPALQLFAVSLYHLVTDEKVGEEYRTEIIPTMLSLLTSINTVDQNLCYLNLFALRSVVVLGIPLEDSSRFSISKKDEISKPLKKMFQQTALIGDFASQFLDCCFKIIESNNEDLFNYSKKGLSLKTVLFDILVHILASVSEEKVKNFVNRLYRYVTNHLYESVNCCHILHQMIAGTILMDHTGYAMEKFNKGIIKNILESIEDKKKYSDICQSEFVYYLSLLTSSFNDGSKLLPYKAQLVNLFKTLLAIDFEDNSQQISVVTNSLGCLFTVLTTTYPLRKVENICSDSSNPDHRYNLLQHFPKEVQMSELYIKWHTPSREEIIFARQLYREFIKPQMVLLENWSNSQINLTKAELERTLNSLLSFNGLRDTLPKFNEEKPKHKELYFTSGDIFTLKLFDGDNLRDDIITLMPKVVNRLRDSPSENIPALKLIIKILDYAIFPADSVNGSATPSDFSLLDEFCAEDVLTASETMNTKMPKNIIASTYEPMEHKREWLLPLVHMQKIVDYHMKMTATLKSWTNAHLTSKHRQAVDQLVELSTCSCTEVRIDAQAVLLDVFESYPRSLDSIVPKLAENLALAHENYDAFKGTLFLLIGTATKSLLLSDNWDSVVQLWPALVATNFVEKPKIVDMLDNDVIPLFTGYYFTIPIERNLLSSNFPLHFMNASKKDFDIPTAEQVQHLESVIEATNKKNRHSYGVLVQKLVETLGADKHWKFYNLGFCLLNLMIRCDEPVPRPVAELFLNNMLHDSEAIRRTAVSGMRKILYLQKPEKVRKEYNIDNKNLDQIEMDCYQSEEQYCDQTEFYDKVHLGFYDKENTVCHPPEPIAYMAMVSMRADPNKLAQFRFIADRFQNAEFLDKLFELNSVEKEKCARLESLAEAIEELQNIVPINTDGLGLMIGVVDDNMAKMFQYLFELYGLGNTELIYPRIDALLSENKPNHDKLAIEILVGMLKASVNYDYQQIVSMRDFVLCILRKYLYKMQPESKNTWNYLFTTIFVNRDLRRFMWLFDFLFTDELFTEAMTMSSQVLCLGFLSNMLADNWKYPQVSERVLAKLEQNLDYKYHDVRVAVAGILARSVFHRRVGLSLFSSIKPEQGDFMKKIQTRLELSLKPLLVEKADLSEDQCLLGTKSAIFDRENEEGQQFNNYIETVGTFLFNSLLSKSFVSINSYIELIPYLCLIRNKNNKQLQETINNLIATLSVQCYEEEQINSVILHILKISKNWNWHTRNESIVFLNNFIYTNIFTLREQIVDDRQGFTSWLERLLGITLTLIKDEVLELRESARKTLTNLIAWKIYPKTRHEELIKELKTDCVNPNIPSVARHGAILGLCAYVMANPVKLPKYLPNIVIFLMQYLNEPQPIQKSVNETLKSFVKTHQDNWVEHKTKFTPEELTELSECSMFSSYIS